MADRKETLAELARVLEGQSRRLAHVVPVIDDQEMRCEAREAASNAIELVVEIGTLLNQSDIPWHASESVGNRSLRVLEGIHRLCNDLLPVLQQKTELMEKQQFLNRCWEANS